MRFLTRSLEYSMKMWWIFIMNYTFFLRSSEFQGNRLTEAVISIAIGSPQTAKKNLCIIDLPLSSWKVDDIDVRYDFVYYEVGGLNFSVDLWRIVKRGSGPSPGEGEDEISVGHDPREAERL